jgi:hypothetical protein
VNPGNVMSWQHIGQHGEASIDFYRNGTMPAGEKEQEIALQYAQEIGEYCEVIKRLIVSTIGKAEGKVYTADNVDAFTTGYAVCALWSSNDESDESGGKPMDDNYGLDDIAPETWKQFAEDCEDFQKANKALLRKYYKQYKPVGGHDVTECAGHDFWLTRNGHGAGFWDRGIGELGDELSKAATIYSGVDLYIGDDGKVYSN